MFHLCLLLRVRLTSKHWLKQQVIAWTNNSSFHRGRPHYFAGDLSWSTILFFHDLVSASDRRNTMRFLDENDDAMTWKKSPCNWPFVMEPTSHQGIPSQRYPTHYWPNSKSNSRMIYHSKSTYCNINPQLREYINENNIEMYHFLNTFWTFILRHVWRPLYEEYTSLPKGHHKNQGFYITIIMLVNIFFSFIKAFEMIFKGNLKTVFHLTIDKHIKNNHVICKDLRYAIYNIEIKKGTRRNGHMNWHGHGHLDEFHAGYWKQPVNEGSVIFMADVTVFYVTMLRKVTNHVFFHICR